MHYRYPLITLTICSMFVTSILLTPLSANSGTTSSTTSRIEVYSKKRASMTVEQFLTAYYDILAEGFGIPDTYRYIEVKNAQIRKGSPLYRSFQKGIMLGITKNHTTDLNLKSKASEDILARMIKRDFGYTIESEKGKPLTYTRLTHELGLIMDEYLKSQTIIPTGDTSDLELYRAVESILLNNFYKKEAIPSAEKRQTDAIQGMVSGFGDLYTEYYPPLDAKELNASLSNSIVGVGITIEKVGADWVVTSTIEGGSAGESGIVKGDIIKKVNDTVLSSDLRIEEVVGMIRGEIGSKVTLEISRSGVTTSKVLERRKVSAPNISLESLDSQTLLVKIRMFSLDFPIEELKKSLQVSIKEGKTRLVFDLRGNPGGSIESYAQIAGLFVPNNTEINTFVLRNSSEVLSSIGDGAFASSFGSIGVIVDEHSASASEMLALFLKEQKQAKIFGAKTFGKGVAQQILDFSDGSSLKYTFAEWRSAGYNTSIQGVGITPDISLVGLSEEQARARILSGLTK